MNKRKKTRIGLIFIILILVYFVYVSITQQSLLNAKERQMENVQSKLDTEQKRNKELKEQKKKLSSDEYIEKIAREKLGMVKSGEKVFVDINK